MTTQEITTHKLILSTSVLSRCLAPLKVLIAKNPVVPILDHFLFSCDGATLTVTASNMQVFLSVEVPVESTTDGFFCCVPAKLLTDLLDKLPEQPATMLIGESLTLLTDNGEYELPLQGEVDYPSSSEATDGLRVSLPVDQLQYALYHTTFATSDNELRPAMGCVYIESKLGLRFMATDGHRAVCVDRPDAGLDPFSALLPRKAAALLTKLLADSAGDVDIEIRPTTILFWIGPYLLEVRQVDETFPDVLAAIKSNPYQLTIGKQDLGGVLKRLLVFADKTTALIRMDLEMSNQVRLSVNNETMERRATEKLFCDYPGDPLTIGFNGGLLLEMIEHIDGPMVTLSLESPTKAVFIHEESTPGEVTVTSLLMPQQVNG
ncbi:MAG: polymerase subunit beta [Spirosoma sp.]|nr:polymerase subunit beta [Spirosoma sp.]